MDITSIYFYIFVGIVLLIYWNLPQKYQWKLLLASSVLFYCLSAHPATILYLIFSIVTVYCAVNYFQMTETRGNADENSERKRRRVLIITLVANVGLLVILKYTNLGIHTWNRLFAGCGIVLDEVHWLEPLAISFYTLQLVSYLLDCYWGVAQVEKNVFRLALFASYFPQMVSGPISRYSEIGDQLFEKHGIDYNRVVHGLKRIAWGLLKKLAISNRVAVAVNAIWEKPETFSGFYIWIVAAGFAIQLYTDFSGCMDIVLGVSECFGIYLPENFRAPLLSKSVQEFWQRWHITLGGWLRDYIMNPLSKSDAMINFGQKCRKRFGKKRGKKIPVYLSMFAVWFLMGLWHGNSWSFVAQGLWFWMVIVLGQMLKEPFGIWKKKLHINEKSFMWQAFQVVRTFAAFVVGSIFFRADSLFDAFHRIGLSTKMNFDFGTFKDFAHFCYSVDIGGKLGLLIAVVAFLFVAVVDFCIYLKSDRIFRFFEKHSVAKWVGYYALVFILILSLDIRAQEFLYAQF